VVLLGILERLANVVVLFDLLHTIKTLVGRGDMGD
jgi:hypothetical protein